MKTPDHIIHWAKVTATYSSSKFRVGAVVHDGHKVLGWGYNQPLKTHPKSPSPYKNIHAEFDAIIGVKRIMLRGASIYVHRLKADGTPGLAKPCRHCASMLKGLGIIKIEYSEG